MEESSESGAIDWKKTGSDSRLDDLDSDDGSDTCSVISGTIEDESWAILPHVVLEKVFSLLSLKDRYHASIVCKHWYDTFYSPCIWRKLVMPTSVFTHQRYTPYKGYWVELSNHKVQKFLQKVGSFMTTLQINPIPEYYNLFAFLRIFNIFLEHDCKDTATNSLTNFYFTFCCESRDGAQVAVYGSGGQLLEEIKRFLRNLEDVEELKVNHLLLDLSEAPGVLEHMVLTSRLTLTYLQLRNFTKELYPLFILGMFQNLRTLVVSPQHLSDDVVKKIGRSHVTNLHIIQDQYSFEAYEIEKDTWKVAAERTPRLGVRLSARGTTPLEINWQEGAPVTSIVYTTKYSVVDSMAIANITMFYNTTLKVYAHFDLPRYKTVRCDVNLVNLMRTCSKIHTLIIRQRISTATLILLAREGRSLRRLYVRRNAIIKRCDWGRALTWGDDYYWTMRRASHSYESTFAEVSKCLGFQWAPLTDKEFKRLQPLYCDTNSAQSDFETI